MSTRPAQLSLSAVEYADLARRAESRGDIPRAFDYFHKASRSADDPQHIQHFNDEAARVWRLGVQA